MLVDADAARAVVELVGDNTDELATEIDKLATWADGERIDSTGILMLRNQRHLDRGAGEPDLGQYDKPEDVFGPTGAAALYRTEALQDAAFDGQSFDEDFFAYREDADLAWRCRLMGWNAIYVPAAVALHGRRVTPERRRKLPALINYHSVKNRFLLRLNNMTGSLYRRDFCAISLRDAAVIGYVFLREWSSLGALFYLLRHLPRLWRKRKLIQSKRRIAPPELEKWFVEPPSGRQQMNRSCSTIRQFR